MLRPKHLNTSQICRDDLFSLMLKHQQESPPMATRHRNNKPTYKGIRFPYELVEEIDASVEREKNDNLGTNFSAWVLDACGRRKNPRLS